jgi:hypothetical protein
MHILNIAIDNLTNVRDSGRLILTEEFLTGLKERVDSIDRQECSVIRIDTVRGSINFINYLIKTKLILADYDFNYDSTPNIHDQVISYISENDPARIDTHLQELYQEIENTRTV